MLSVELPLSILQLALYLCTPGGVVRARVGELRQRLLNRALKNLGL